MTLYTPALDWILQGVAANAPEKLLVEILTRCKEKCNNSALLLNTIMAAFKPSYIAARALQFIEMVSACDEEGESTTLSLYFVKKEFLCTFTLSVYFLSYSFIYIYLLSICVLNRHTCTHTHILIYFLHNYFGIMFSKIQGIWNTFLYVLIISMRWSEAAVNFAMSYL